MSAPTRPVHDREATAEWLLRSSLDGTELWDGLTEEQRRTLTVHEVCSVGRASACGSR